MNYLSMVAADILAELPGHLVPDERAHDLMLIYAVLATTVGTSVSAKHVHDAWVAWMIYRGQEHESMVPYEALPPTVQYEDEPYAEAIRRVARRRGIG